MVQASGPITIIKIVRKEVLERGEAGRWEWALIVTNCPNIRWHEGNREMHILSSGSTVKIVKRELL